MNFKFFAVIACLFYGFSFSFAMKKQKGPKVSAIFKEVSKGNITALNIRGPNGYTLLHFAAYKNNEGLLKRVIKHGGALNCRDRNGCSPLHVASYFGHTKIVQLLIDAKADIYHEDDRKRMPWDMAFQTNNWEVMEKLMGTSMKNTSDELTSGDIELDDDDNDSEPLDISEIDDAIKGVLGEY